MPKKSILNFESVLSCKQTLNEQTKGLLEKGFSNFSKKMFKINFFSTFIENLHLAS
jgi:hypothetical protein